MTNMLDDHINVHGTEVQNAWGFVMNYLGRHDDAFSCFSTFL